MTKKQFEKYYKDVRDIRGKLLKVGDIVVASYCSTPFIGIVHHFCSRSVVLYFENNHSCYIWRGQKRPEFIMKLNISCDNYPELKNKLDNYGKSILELPSM